MFTQIIILKCLQFSTSKTLKSSQQKIVMKAMQYKTARVVCYIDVTTYE